MSTPTLPCGGRIRPSLPTPSRSPWTASRWVTAWVSLTGPVMPGAASGPDMSASGGPGPGRMRLAELVGALSLGVDLGFGQPMEHVLRQSMIALRLGEAVGLGEDERSVVYYTAPLVNVGGHSD